MDLIKNRKIEVNEWLINARWFFTAGVFLIGVLSKFLSYSNIDFSLWTMVVLLVVFGFINILLYVLLGKLKLHRSPASLQTLSTVQIAVDLIILIIIMHNAGGIESISATFFFLPIISSSLLYGNIGSILVAFFSTLAINGLVILEYYDFVPHVYRYGVATMEFDSLPITLTKTISVSIFYFVVAVYSGYGIGLLNNREYSLQQSRKKLKREREYRENEFKQLEKTSKLLVRRDKELTTMNMEMDKKITEQERVEKSMLKAFSDLKREREKSEDERDKTLAIISNFIDPIIVMDNDNKVTLFNPAAKTLFSMSDDDLGKEVKSDDNYSMNNFKRIIKAEFEVKQAKDANNDDLGYEELTIGFIGQTLTYKVITAAVVDKDGDNFGVMKIFYNLTREKMIDKLKSEFISIASHQLRTPLTAIKWAIKMVLDEEEGELNEAQKQMLYKGYKSNERIIVLVNDLLDVSRIEEGRFGYSFGKADFVDSLENVVDNLEVRIHEKGIKFVVDKPEQVPEVYMDKQKMSLVLQNLLENAVKYTPEHGKIETLVEVGEHFIKIRIKDNGVGIPKEDREKLFSKFFRAQNVIRMQTEGSGLGLFIVKNIIKKHGGEITCNSEEGVGTEFVFTLPIEQKKDNN